MSETLIAAQTDPAASDQTATTEATTAVADQGQTQQSEAQSTEQTLYGEKTGETEQSGEPEKAPQGAPESYGDFEVPEGHDLGSQADRIKATAKALNLTQEQAQELVKLDVERVAEYRNQLDSTRNVWADQTKADPELGGDRLAENMAVAKVGLDSFGSPALKQLLAQSGLGNHPEIIRAFFKAGKAISQDGSVVVGRPAPAAAKTAEQVLYGNS